MSVERHEWQILIAKALLKLNYYFNVSTLEVSMESAIATKILRIKAKNPFCQMKFSPIPQSTLRRREPQGLPCSIIPSCRSCSSILLPIGLQGVWTRVLEYIFKKASSCFPHSSLVFQKLPICLFVTIFPS